LFTYEKTASTLESDFLENHIKYQIVTIESEGKLYSYFLEVYTNKGSNAYPETITKLNDFTGTLNVFLLNGVNLGSVAIYNGRAKNISENDHLNVLTESINVFMTKSGATNKMPQCGGNYTVIIDQTTSRFDIWSVGNEIILIKYLGDTTTRTTSIMPYPCDGVYDKNDILNQRLEFYNYNTGVGTGSGTQGTSLAIDIEGEKIDPKEETKCLDKSKPAVLTVYVQQPNENTRDKLGANSVGHTFIGIQQGTIQRLIGFYPDSPNASLISSQKSELHDNSNTLYHVSISIEIDAAKLINVINYIDNYSQTYDLNNYNCSDFAISVAEKGGLNLPKTTGSYNAVLVKFKGRNPGDLGQDIRNMSTPSGATKSLTKGNAPKKKGGC
jgi:hypothetical protein